MFVHVFCECLCIPLDKGEQPASSHGAPVLLYVSTCPQHLQKCCPTAVFPSESSRRLSEGFGTGGEGDRVGHGFLWVAAVVVNLEQDGDVYSHLQQTACPKLHRSLGEQEVARFKGVSTGPHQHHLDAVKEEAENRG